MKKPRSQRPNFNSLIYCFGTGGPSRLGQRTISANDLHYDRLWPKKNSTEQTSCLRTLP